MAEVDPYAPPKEESAPPREKRTRWERALAAERRSVLLVLILSIATLGFYSSVWYIRRTPFVNGLKSDQQLSPNLPWALLAVEVLTFVVAIAEVAMDVRVDVSRPFSIAGFILALNIRFRIAHMLRSHFARTGMMRGVSGAATFFFGVLYLQWVINDAADAVPPRPRKKKRRKKEDGE